MICLSIDDSSSYLNPVLYEDRSDLSISVVDANGGMFSQVMRSIGPFMVESVIREEGGFEYAVDGAENSRPLLAMTSWMLVAYCTGSRFSISAPLRLVSYENKGFRSILDHPSGCKPVLLRTKSGIAWMAWEAMTASNPVEEFPDRHYRAEIRIARISSDNRVELSYSLGPGYSPKLVEREDGTVLVLYRIADHSEAREEFRLQLTSLNDPGGGDAVIDDSLSIRYWWTPELSVTATADNGLLVLMDRIDSVVVYHCDAAANVTRSAAVAATDGQQKYLLFDHDGRIVLLWRRTAGEDIVWTPLEEGRMFKSINSIPGTASITEWKSFRGRDGNIKIITHPTGAAVLNIISNATSSTPTTRELYSPDTFWGKVLDWHLDSQDALWIAHRQEVHANRWQTGLYRVRDLSLPSTNPPALVESPALYPNSPNPFTSSTTLRYSIPTPMQIHLLVHDALGREIRRFGNAGVTAAGMHTEHLETKGLSPGVYFYTLIAGGQRQTGMMVLL
ncbi:MAG: T9SS type A sorting domain-containing protein [Bacteroidota bacterium]